MNKGLLDFADFMDRDAQGYRAHAARVGVNTPALIAAAIERLAAQARAQALAEPKEVA